MRTRILCLIGIVVLLLTAGRGPAVRPLVAQNEGAIANGATTRSYLSVGVTEDEAEIKATPGIVLSITATNSNAAVRYLKCYNLTAANASPGTSTPWLRLAIPAAVTGGALHVTFPVGAVFSTALTCALVTGAADSDATEVAASEVMYFLTFK
jgi:hypothetical protein